MTSLTLDLQRETLAVVRLAPSEPVPEWAARGAFFSITRTPDELSIVCESSQVPTDARVERPWRALKVRGPLEFSLTGILASLSGALAAKGVSLFAVSTFDTDYLLVKSERLESAILALSAAGHTVTHESRFETLPPACVLNTARLALEPVAIGHASELTVLFSDPLLHTFVPLDPWTIEQARERCARWEKRLSPSGEVLWLNWLARDRANGRVVGHFQATVNADRTASVGYLVERESQNRGIGTEGVLAMLRTLEHDFAVHSVKAWSDTRNLASHRLLRKLGFSEIETIRNADHFKGSSSDEFVFRKVLQS